MFAWLASRCTPALVADAARARYSRPGVETSIAVGLVRAAFRSLALDASQHLIEQGGHVPAVANCPKEGQVQSDGLAD